MAELRTDLPDAGAEKINLMLDLLTESPSAAQSDFPKTDIQVVQMSRNPDWTLAALRFYVSHADKPVSLCKASQLVKITISSTQYPAIKFHNAKL